MTKQPTLSIIIPVYNEKNTIEEILSRLLKVKIPSINKEVIVVNDGSTDETVAKLEKLKRKFKQTKSFKTFKIISHSDNLGKGMAIRSGLLKVSGDYVLIQDADLEYDPQDIPKLLRPIQENKAEVVYGSRFTGEHRNLFFWHLLGNKLLSFLTDVLYNSTLTDMEVGYKLFPNKLLKKINLRCCRFEFEPEVTAKILKRGIRIYEVPISYAGRDYHEGKKITWRDGIKAIWVLFRERFKK